MKKYYTGLLVHLEEPNQPQPPFKGRGWEVIYVPERNDPPRLRTGKEISIKARTWDMAQRALNLIYSSLTLIHGLPIEAELVAHNKKEPDFEDEIYRTIIEGNRLSLNAVPTACKIAAKASRKKSFVYALSKYKHSISIYTLSRADYFHNGVHLPISRFPDDHVMFAYAILSAYSVIEDLGLEIRASASNPSKKDGKWNPAVKNDIEGRLLSAGVDIRKPFTWLIRGTERKVEKIREMPVLNKTPWAWGMVRDSEIMLLEAIARADWLRDKLAAHKIHSLSGSLSPFDVVNVQMLSRRLILEALGHYF